MTATEPGRDELAYRLEKAAERAGPDWAYRPLVMEAVRALRLSISAVREATIEECAKIADTFHHWQGSADLADDDTKRAVARKIRSLTTEPKRS